MSKSVWKFLRTNQDEIYMYIDEFKKLREKKGLQTFGLVKKSLSINNINFMHTYSFNIGENFITRKFYPFAIGLTGSSFLKYKKPVHYYSKKKKKKK